MRAETKEDSEITAYLLGELSESDREAVEQRVMIDDAYFERLVRIEERLEDQYAAGRLDDLRRARFDAHFGKSPARADDIAFARTFNKWVSKEAAVIKVPDAVAARSAAVPLWSRSPFIYSLIGAVIILAIGCAVLWQRVSSVTAELAAARSDSAKAAEHNDEMNRRLAEKETALEKMSQQLQELLIKPGKKGAEEPRQPAPQISDIPRSVISLILNTTIRGGNQVNQVRLNTETKLVELIIDLPGSDAQSYGLKLSTAEGHQEWAQENMIPKKAGTRLVLSAHVPASLLTRSDYLVSLTGKDAGGNSGPVRTYSFRVIHQ